MKIQKQSVYHDKPDEWNIYPIKKIGKVITGTTPKTSVDEYYDGEYLFVSPGDLDETRVVNKSSKSLTQEGFEQTRPVPKNSVLFTSIGSTIGKTSIAGCELATNQQINAVVTNEKVDPNFLYNTLLFYRNYIKKLAGTQAVPIINKSSFESLRLPFPPKEEQVKIIDLLNTWDHSILKIENLIQAKKRYKKGLMQQLLSGKKRFPEFEGEQWEEVKLRDIFKRITEKNEDIAENILTISSTGGFLDQTNKFGGVIAGKNLENYTLIKRGDFAYNKGNSLTYPQGCIFKLEDYDHAAVPNVYYCFRPKYDSIYSDFYKYYFELGKLNHQLSRVINTGVRNDGLLNLKMDDFFNLKIKKPPLPEQKKIADTIDPVDQEIDLLEKKLAAFKKQKKGLMQQLLTGNVRVSQKELLNS